jgi:hypothetical protein
VVTVATGEADRLIQIGEAVPDHAVADADGPQLDMSRSRALSRGRAHQAERTCMRCAGPASSAPAGTDGLVPCSRPRWATAS